MRWYVIDKDYVNYLHSIDNKVEFIDYKDKLKPYFGIIYKINGFNYYLPVSSAKEKHKTMKNNLDFLKLIDKDGKIIAVLNINNMIPVPSQFISDLNYKDIDQYRTFENEFDKKIYIDLLRKELDIINSMPDKIKKNANLLYEFCKQYPNNKLTQRCCNFRLLQEKAIEYASKVIKLEVTSSVEDVS